VSQTAWTSQGGFFGHPRGLATLFFTEMWERFSYYGMRGILILFMVDAIQTGGLGLTVGRAATVYGLYTAAAYLMALPGGWFADKVVGPRNAVFYGGVLIAAGQFCLALAATVPVGFYSGLVLIVSGTGLLKPNVSAIVGRLYPEGGARRDAGFSVFYMGINLGAFIGPLVCGALGEHVAWKWAFTAAGVGMVLGLVQYKMGAGLADLGRTPAHDTAERAKSRRTLLGTAFTILAVSAAVYLLQSRGITAFTLEQFADATGYLIFGLVVAYFVSLLVSGEWDAVVKKRLVLIFLLVVGSALFWSGFEQAGSSMNLFAAQYTDRVIFGWQAPASWLQAVNPIFIITLAPVFGWIWLALGSKNPSVAVKFGLGLVLLGLGFLVMAWAAVYATPVNGVSPMWLVVAYFLHTSGELCVSPIGLSAVTKLAPNELVGRMMGVWFMGTSLGNLIAGRAAGLMEDLPLTRLFGTVAGIVLGSGILYILFKRPISKLSEGVE